MKNVRFLVTQLLRSIVSGIHGGFLKKKCFTAFLAMEGWEEKQKSIQTLHFTENLRYRIPLEKKIRKV